MSQGHPNEKDSDPLHADADVQSASARGGRDAQSQAKQGESGEDQPLDAARQGSTGGSAKKTTAQKEARGPDRMSGSFKDQVGGQDERDKGPGVEAGGSETAAGYNVAETVKNAVTGSKTTTVSTT